ncbi:MAG: hypothetical protein E6J41_16990 [Chloroflexi bacterium]|nr:MAG: hypothetical protein E6J41_16990 [Chloroflexota bacterium]
MVYGEFVFEGYRYDAAARALSLTYRFTDGPRFTEELRFEVPPRELTSQDRVVLDRETAAFMQVFYERGLAEFAYRNGLSLRDHLEFAWEPSAPDSDPVAIDLPRRTCVPVGGGKDSIVTLECLKQSGEDVTAFALGSAEPIAACIATAGVPALRVHRRLDSQLFALNQNGALNGHVPITGILSTIVLAAAVLAGCDTVAMSNEHSASVPNLVADGVEVNHQYSKSLDFEGMLADYLCSRITPGLSYFSLLRPLSEIEIARRFAGSPQYLPVFRSCNAAFKQSPTERARTWCGNCPKCRFVFLALRVRRAVWPEEPQAVRVRGRRGRERRGDDVPRPAPGLEARRGRAPSRRRRWRPERVPRAVPGAAPAPRAGRVPGAARCESMSWPAGGWPSGASAARARPRSGSCAAGCRTCR